ncbi:relaxase/mobilization nuclease domain-containing protein, partial (plasmid) [Lacticaseibacillus paracasei]
HHSQQQERHTLAERKISAKGAYVWKDDLRSRIDSVMQDSRTIDFKAFSAYLFEKGVTVHDRGQNVSYAFLDAQNKQRRVRGPKLGTSYEKGAITHELANRTQAREAQRLSEQEQQRVINAHRATEQRKYQTQSRERTAQQREPNHASATPNLEHLANTSGHLEQKARSMGTHYRQLRQRIKTAIKPLAAELQRFSEAIPRFAQTISTYLQNQIKSNYVALKQKLEAELNPASKSPKTPTQSETYQQLLGKIKENEAIGEQRQQAQQRQKKVQQQQHEGPTLGL